MHKLLLLVALLLLNPLHSGAQQKLDEFKPTIHILGRKSITVTKPTVNLGDLAQINSRTVRDDEAVIALQKIEIVTSPAPGKDATISASSVLDRLRESGVDLTQVGYVLPRVMKIERASRTLRKDEIFEAIERYLKKSDREIALRNVNYNNDVQVSPGMAKIEAIPFTSSENGRMRFQMRVGTKGAEEIRFNVQANVDEWIEVPVASRPLGRGEVVRDDDVIRARMNARKLPRDAAHREDGVVGFEMSQSVGYGEVFRRAMLKIPPVVKNGSRVTLQYSSGLLEATATGVALEEGIVNQMIKVRNLRSKKVVSGKVIEPGLVRIEP